MDTFSDILTKNPIVIDNGSGMMKAGIAGDEKPRLVFPTFVGYPKYHQVIMDQQHQNILVGNSITEEKRGLLKLKYPIHHGIINNWDQMDKIWSYIYSELKVNPKECPVLLTEPPLNPHKHKFQLAQNFFENYGVPALFVGIQGVLSLFATGKTTGVVFDCGDGVTQVVPVFDGFSLSHAASRIDLGGRDITEYLQLLLRRSGFSFHTSAEFEVIKKIKESKCVVSFTAQDVDHKYYEETKIKDNYTLPDGNNIDLTFEKTRAPEILFSPEKIGLEYPSLPELLVQSINKCDLDLRRKLYSEIVLSGGTTQMQDFPERFINELKKLIKKDLKLKIYSPNNRNELQFSGGSILTTLTSFKSMWVMKKDWEEEGERILLKKSF